MLLQSKDLHSVVSRVCIFSMLKVDNDGEQQIAETTYIKNEGYRLDLSAPTSSYDKSTSFTSAGGHTVRTSS